MCQFWQLKQQYIISILLSANFWVSLLVQRTYTYTCSHGCTWLNQASRC